MADAPNLYRAAHEARIIELRRRASAVEAEVLDDLALLAEEFGAWLRDMFARHTPPGGVLLVEDRPDLTAEVLRVWGNFADAWDETAAAGRTEWAALLDRATVAEAALTGRPAAAVEPPVGGFVGPCDLTGPVAVG